MSKIITSMRGHRIVVDDEDFEYLNSFTWRVVRSGIRGKRYARQNKTGLSLARILMKPTRNMIVDHINHNTLDNRKENLRLCSRTENNRNRLKTKKKCSSKYKGVCRNKLANKWGSYIGYRKKMRFLGYYDSEKEAAQAYDKKAKELFGEFASLNFKGK